MTRSPTSMTRRTQIAGMLAAGALGAAGPSRAATPKEKVSLPFTEYGTLGTAKYEIVIPEGWNGGLAMYAPGYIPPDQPYDFNPPQKRAVQLFFEHVRAKGYATARSAFSRNGLNWFPGVQETEALRLHFVERFGLGGPSFHMGQHGGGIISRFVAERYPEAFDGYMTLGGNGGNTITALRGAFEMRALFDYYFPGLPGSPAEDSPPGQGWGPADALALIRAGSPQDVASFLKLTRYPSAEEAAAGLALFAGLMRDIRRYGTNGANGFDNTNVIYVGSHDDAGLNRGIKRYAADPEAARILREDWAMTGRFGGKFLSLHSLRDQYAPPQGAEHYLTLVQQAGTQDRYVVTWMDFVGAGYPKPVIAKVFDDLERWVKEGVRPSPGELKL